jgi:nucleotide-binding universal stress UspA family protein
MSIFPAKILLATDGSAEAELAGRAATELADKTGSELHVVHVFGLTPWYPAYPEGIGLDETEPEDPLVEADLQRFSEERARELLDAEVEKISALGGTVAQAHLREGGLAQEIVLLAEEMGAGSVVVGSRGRGRIRRALMGSVSDSLVRHAHCPVMVVRWKPLVLPARILVATDASEEASLAVATAADLAQRTGSELHVVHVGEVRPVYHPERRGYLARYEKLQEEARHLLDGQVRKIESTGGTVASAHLRMGRPDEEIVLLGEQTDADMIVMGSRGLGGTRRALLGSASDSVVRHAHCPVMVVRTDEGRAAEQGADVLAEDL